MKIEKKKLEYLAKQWFYHYYIDSKTGNKINHGINYRYLWWGVGYRYHDQVKGFYLRRRIGYEN